jgi:hypothetical protein
MKLWRSMMKLPQPIKGSVVVYLIVFVLAFVSVPLLALIGQNDTVNVTPWTSGALGLSAVLFGRRRRRPGTPPRVPGPGRGQCTNGPLPLPVN